MHSRQAALAWQWMGLQAGLATRHLGRTQISLTCRHFAASSYCCTLVQPSVLICTWARMVVLLSFSWFRVKSTDLLSGESTGTKGTHRSKINVPGEAFAESACDHMQQKLQFKEFEFVRSLSYSMLGKVFAFASDIVFSAILTSCKTSHVS